MSHSRSHTSESINESAIQRRRRLLHDKRYTSIYVHFPFCSKLCGYCDFHKELFDRRKSRLYFDALMRETELALPEAENKEIVSIYIGGGTPSLAEPDLLTRWSEFVHSRFTISEDVEFTVEVNPESATREVLELFRDAGVNRVSVGVQSFNPRALQVLDRRHRVEDTQRVFYQLRALGYTNFSADLIFGLPDQTLSELQSDLTQLIELEPSHISFYQLTVKENTPLYDQVQSGALTLPDDEIMSVFYRAGCDFLAENNYRRYEISSFAPEGSESLHNLRYWSGAAYIGLGPGAHGFTGDQRYWNVSDTELYIDSLLKHAKRPIEYDSRTKHDAMFEEIMLGLRMTEGIDRHEFFHRHNRHIIDAVNKTEYKRLVEKGHIVPDIGHIRLSEDALALADEIILRLAP